jgi:hypothetical protein
MLIFCHGSPLRSVAQEDYMLLAFVFSVYALTAGGDPYVRPQNVDHATTDAAEAISVYESIAMASGADQKELYRTLSSGVQAEVWRIHLLQYLVAHRELTDLQKTVIRDAMALLRDESFEVGIASPQFAERLAQLDARAKTVFGIAEAKAIFAELGSAPDSADVDTRSPHPVLQPRSLHPVLQSTSAGPVVQSLGCSCSTISDFCSPGSACVYGDCISRPEGCGVFWQYACTGRCYPFP